MYRIRKSFTFEAAHQLEAAYTKACSDCIHGHSYTVEMFLQSVDLDAWHMVLDFGLLKTFKQLVMDEWDHGLILHENRRPFYDPLIDAGQLKREKVHYFRESPTAEVMARKLFLGLRDYLPKSTRTQQGLVVVTKVRVHETSTGWAEYSE